MISLEEIVVGTKVRVGRFAGCTGQHTLASDEVRVMGMKNHERDHVLVRSVRVNGPSRWVDAWIPLEHVELLDGAQRTDTETYSLQVPTHTGPTADGGFKLPDPGGVIYLGAHGWAAAGFVANANGTYSPIC